MTVNFTLSCTFWPSRISLFLVAAFHHCKDTNIYKQIFEDRVCFSKGHKLSVPAWRLSSLATPFWWDSEYYVFFWFIAPWPTNSIPSRLGHLQGTLYLFRKAEYAQKETFMIPSFGVVFESGVQYVFGCTHSVLYELMVAHEIKLSSLEPSLLAKYFLWKTSNPIHALL